MSQWHCKMGSAVVWSLVLYILLVTQCMPARSESNGDKIKELLKLQEAAGDGVITLDDNSLKRFALQSGGRPYSLLVFFNAVHMYERPGLKLQELRREFGLAATAYIKHNQGKEAATQVFFVELEVGRAQVSFNLFGVNSLPMIRHLGPGKGNLKESQPLNPASLAERAAEGIAAFVEERTKQRVGAIERPPLISRQQMVVMAGGLALAAPFVVKWLMAGNTPFHEKQMWCTLALIIYFFSVSGGMYNIIRGSPFFMLDRNNPGRYTFFYPQSGMQLGAEGFVVGILYTTVGIVLALFSHFLVKTPSTAAQRLVMLLGMAVSVMAVRKVVLLDNWKTGYSVFAYWPNKWRG